VINPVEHSVGESGTDQGIVQTITAANTNAAVIEEGAIISDGASPGPFYTSTSE
jgi:hypothetical protein